MPTVQANRSGRHGISLLELILALTILGGAMVVLAQIAGTGTDAAMEARDLAVARLICQRKMSELLLNTVATPVAVPPSPAEPFDSTSTSNFMFSVEVMPGQLDGLLVIRVRVEAVDSNGGPATAVYTLDRWMIDPALGLAEMEAEAEMAREQDAASGEVM